MGTTDTSGHFIVVGVDGSEPSKKALQWAARQAELTCTTLQAVMTWSVPVMAYGTPMPVPFDLDLRPYGHRVLAQALTECLGEKPAIKVSATVIEGRPSGELIKAAEGADLLVVGSRGHGALAGMLLGSVSEHCVTHAHCPVVVVR